MTHMFTKPVVLKRKYLNIYYPSPSFKCTNTFSFIFTRAQVKWCSFNYINPILLIQSISEDRVKHSDIKCARCTRITPNNTRRLTEPSLKHIPPCHYHGVRHLTLMVFTNASSLTIQHLVMKLNTDFMFLHQTWSYCDTLVEVPDSLQIVKKLLSILSHRGVWCCCPGGLVSN